MLKLSRSVFPYLVEARPPLLNNGSRTLRHSVIIHAPQLLGGATVVRCLTRSSLHASGLHGGGDRSLQSGQTVRGERNVVVRCGAALEVVRPPPSSPLVAAAADSAGPRPSGGSWGGRYITSLRVLLLRFFPTEGLRARSYYAAIMLQLYSYKRSCCGGRPSTRGPCPRAPWRPARRPWPPPRRPPPWSGGARRRRRRQPPPPQQPPGRGAPRRRCTSRHRPRRSSGGGRRWSRSACLRGGRGGSRRNSVKTRGAPASSALAYVDQSGAGPRRSKRSRTSSTAPRPSCRAPRPPGAPPARRRALPGPSPCGRTRRPRRRGLRREGGARRQRARRVGCDSARVERE